MASEDRRSELYVVIGLFISLAWIFFCMRIYVRFILTKGWGVDDIFLTIAIIIYTVYCTFAAMGVRHGTGRHLQDIPPHDIPLALHWWYLCELLYTLTTVFIRLSISIFLLRILPKRIYKIIIYCTMAVVIAYSIFYFFLILFQCSPPDYFWNQYSGEQGKCIAPDIVPNASIAHSAVSATADWIFVLVPIVLIWHLHLNRRTKWSLAGILCLGLLAGIGTIIRIPYIRNLPLTDDFLYSTTDVGIWSTVEAGLGIIATSAYTLRPLFRSILTSRSRTSSAQKELENWPSRTVTRTRTNPSHQPATQPEHQPATQVEAQVVAQVEATGANTPGISSPPAPRSIRVDRSFEVREEERRQMPWGHPEPASSSVSIV